jgi:hypothetical protein
LNGWNRLEIIGSVTTERKSDSATSHCRARFRRWLEHVLGFVNNGSRGRDPSRRWARGHVFREGARPRAPRGRATRQGCILVHDRNLLGVNVRFCVVL